MRQKSVHPVSPSERVVKNISGETRKRYFPEEKIRNVLVLMTALELKMNKGWQLCRWAAP